MSRTILCLLSTCLTLALASPGLAAPAKPHGPMATRVAALAPKSTVPPIAYKQRTLVNDEPNFKSERDVVKEELRQRVLATPYGRLFALYVPQATYATHPYHRPGIGSIEELDAATLDDVRAFHEAYYRPDDAALIVVGNFDEARLDAWIDKYLGPLKNPAQPIKRVTAVEPKRTHAGVYEGYGPNVPLPAVAITR